MVEVVSITKLSPSISESLSNMEAPPLSCVSSKVVAKSAVIEGASFTGATVIITMAVSHSEGVPKSHSK